MQRLQIRRQGNGVQRGRGLREWELGSRVLEAEFVENHPLLARDALRLRMAKAWPIAVTQGEYMYKYVVLEDDEDIYHVVGVKPNGQLHLKQITGNEDDSHPQYWVCDTSCVEDSIDEMELTEHTEYVYCARCELYHKPDDCTMDKMEKKGELACL